MEKNIVRVKKQDMKDLFTCPICNNLYDQATNISECLHTFCRKCIEDKFIVEKLKACPVCKVGLGVAPLDKLRPDSTWDDLKLKVFKSKQEIGKAAPEAALTSRQYFRKKKRSSLLSSKVLTSAERLEPEKLEGQMKAVWLNQSSSLPEEPHKESENCVKALLNIEQDNDLAGASTSKGCIQKENNSGKFNEEIPPSDDIGKSLSTSDKELALLKSNDTALIVKTAIAPNGEENQNTVLNRSEGVTKEVPGETNKNPVLISSDSDREESSAEKQKNKGKEKQENVSGEKQKNKGKEKQENVSTPRKKISGKKGKEKAAYSPPVLRPRMQRNMNSAGTSSKAAIFKEVEKEVEGSNKQVWVHLVAATNQITDRPLLPQISKPYIRTDGNSPVSSVKKYIANQLGLKREDKLEICLRQEPLCSSLKLQELVDWWVLTTPIAEQKSAMLGSSGDDFVMVLHYSG